MSRLKWNTFQSRKFTCLNGPLNAGTSPASAAKAVEEELSADIKIGIHALNKSSPIALNARGGTLLLAMTKDQERMLERYGHITCIDATYKVVQWGLPFSMLVVVNEHQQAFPVAYFMLQHETEQAITEVLLLIKDMVPKWNPRCMIMDKDQAEINACTSVFPNVTIILCEFHAKQAWLRWLRTSAHGVPKEMQLRVYKLMGSIMKSPTPAVAESRVRTLVWGLVFKTAFKEHLAAFKEHLALFREHLAGFKEHSVVIKEHLAAYREHSAAFSEHLAALKEHSKAYRK